MDLFELIALAGLVNIITRSYLMETFRNKVPGKSLKYLVNCPQCMGFWVGLFYFIFCIYPHSSASLFPWCLLWGGIVSLVSSAITASLDYLSFAKSYLLTKISMTELPNKQEEEE